MDDDTPRDYGGCSFRILLLLALGVMLMASKCSPSKYEKCKEDYGTQPSKELSRCYNAPIG